jgi:hypothetical protein
VRGPPGRPGRVDKVWTCDLRRSPPPTQSHQGLQDGKIGFPSSVVVETLSAPDPERILPVRGPEERVDERRFTQPCFSRDEEELADPRQCCSETSMQRVPFARALGERGWGEGNRREGS